MPQMTPHRHGLKQQLQRIFSAPPVPASVLTSPRAVPPFAVLVGTSPCRLVVRSVEPDRAAGPPPLPIRCLFAGGERPICLERPSVWPPRFRASHFTHLGGIRFVGQRGALQLVTPSAARVGRPYPGRAQGKARIQAAKKRRFVRAMKARLDAWTVQAASHQSIRGPRSSGHLGS